MSLKDRIAALIEAQGPMSVAQFMTVALHDPQSGYYATRDPFGVAGDFITAPEISQMFGEMLGLWCVQLWHDQGCPKNMRLVELGPGRGTLMADMLRVMTVAPELLRSIDIVLVEASPTLRAAQQEKLQFSGVKPRWAQSFDDSMTDRPLLLVANEFFDALPIRQYVRTPRGWCERMVTALNGGLQFALAPTPVPAAAIPEIYGAAPEGGVYESSPAATALAQDIAAIIAKCGGGALIVDYGYDAPHGFGETLQALGSHQFADVLAGPGEDDLSAHVDFAALAAAAKRGGADIAGPASQGEFLARMGVTERAEQLMQANPSEAQTVYKALERLMGPEQMGLLFKVLAILPPGLGAPSGFAP